MKNDNLAQKIKEAFESVLPDIASENLPKESLSLGTLVRSINHDKLAVITDAFYGDVDKDGKKIIIYTILMFPDANRFISSYKKNDQLYISNEYEYDIIAYLMVPPIDINKVTQGLGGNFLL